MHSFPLFFLLHYFTFFFLSLKSSFLVFIFHFWIFLYNILPLFFLPYYFRSFFLIKAYFKLLLHINLFLGFSFFNFTSKFHIHPHLPFLQLISYFSHCQQFILPRSVLFLCINSSLSCPSSPVVSRHHQLCTQKTSVCGFFTLIALTSSVCLSYQSCTLHPQDFKHWTPGLPNASQSYLTSFSSIKWNYFS